MATDSRTTSRSKDEDILDATTGVADGISLKIDTVAGPISIARTTQKALVLMQHC